MTENEDVISGQDLIKLQLLRQQESRMAYGTAVSG